MAHAVEGKPAVPPWVPLMAPGCWYRVSGDRPDLAVTALGAGARDQVSSQIQNMGSNVLMVAPKGPGHLVRSEYVRGAGELERTEQFAGRTND